MSWRSNVPLRSARRALLLVALLSTAACAQSAGPSPRAESQGERGTFEGRWSAAGLRRTLDFAPGHRSWIFDLSGSLLLSGERRPAVGFQARVIGFSDDRVGMRGRSVWTDERGDQVYSDLRGDQSATGNRVFGTFRGGTGRYAGISGEYSFEWKYMVESDDGAISGRAADLKGWALLATPASDKLTERGDP